MSISYSVCAKVSKKSNIWKTQKNIGAILRELCERKHVGIIEAHAIGAGCFLLEIQESSDYTMRTEKVTVAGDILTPMQIHYGVNAEVIVCYPPCDNR